MLGEGNKSHWEGNGSTPFRVCAKRLASKTIKVMPVAELLTFRARRSQVHLVRIEVNWCRLPPQPGREACEVGRVHAMGCRRYSR